MLTFELSKNLEFLRLVGDYESLHALYDIVFEINDNSPLIGDREGWFIGFASDIRHAYQGMRETYPAPKFYPEVGPRFGVDIILPLFLCHQRTIRSSLAYMPHSRSHQAFAYSLDAIAERAIENGFPAEQDTAKHLWENIEPGSTGFDAKMKTRVAIYDSWTAAERKKYFTSLLASFSFGYGYAYESRGGKKPYLL